MNFRTAILGLCFTLLVLSGANCSRAQTEPQEPVEAPPKPAARSIPPIGTDNGPNDIEDQDKLKPDTTPLTGMETATLGSSEMRHDYWIPGAQYAAVVQSGQYGTSTNWFVDNYMIGTFGLYKAWSHSQFVVNYSGGGIFSTNSSQGNSWMSQLALSQSFQWSRWQLDLIDQFSYLPQPQFGFGGGTGLGIPGGSNGPTIPGIGGGYVPNQSIFTAVGPRYSNAPVIQATYQVSPRGSITASGSYGMLRFVDPGSVDNNTLIASLGYNYQITKEDTLGVLYRYSNFQYPGEPQAFADHTISLAYGRKITGRLAFQAYGGPDFTVFRVPVNNQTSKLGFNGSFNLNYAFENGGITGSYFHGLTGGSGVITGATIDQVSFSVFRKLSREWSGQASLGFAKNRELVTSSETNGSPNYNSWTVSAGANRPIGRNLSFAAAYSANISQSSQPGCLGASCNTNQTINYITMTFQWQSRPLILP